MDYKIAMATQLSSLLKNMRKQAGFTQKEMGEKLGVSQVMVAKIEANPQGARFERILQILSVLEMDLVVRERDRKEQNDSSPDEESW